MSKKEPIVIYQKDMDKLHKRGNVTIDDMLLVYQTDPELPTKKDTEEEIEEGELWDWLKPKVICCAKLNPCCPLSKKDVEGKSAKEIKKMLKSKYRKKNSLSKNSEEELDELVGYDGSINSSAIPDGWENNKTISASKTTDATIPMSRGAGMGSGAMGMARRFWLEETKDLEEEDMSVVLGFDETMYMDGDETIEYFKDEHDMDSEEAKERTNSMGKSEESEVQRIVEDDEIIKMLEIILNKQDGDLGVQSPDDSIEDSMLDRKIRHIAKYAKSRGYNMGSVINKFKNE